MVDTKQKTSSSRCRSGCNTCKTRKIKCGEERPNCARCVKSGWKCDGYGDTKTDAFSEGTVSKSLTGSVPNLFLSTPARQGEEEDFAASAAKDEVDRIPIRTSFVSKKRHTGSMRKDWSSDSHLNSFASQRASSWSSWATSTRIVSPAAYEVPFKTLGTVNERQLLQYFRVQAAPDLSGYSSHKFWNTLVLPSCHYELAVRHATLALGAFHREYVVEGRTQPDGERINSNALQQYNKALHQLQKYLSNKELLDERTVLICCKLFYCIEIARQDYTTALRHAKAGLILLKDWKDRADKQKKESPSNMNAHVVDDVNDLVEEFCAVDVQVRIFENGQPPYLVLTTPDERSGAVPCIKSKFCSLSDAWAATNKLLNWGFHFLASRIEHERGMPEDTEIGNLGEWWVLEREIDQWSIAFETFIHNPDSNISSLDKDSITMCATIHRGTKVLVHLAAGKSSFDVNDDFNDILNMAETIINNQDIDSKTPHRGFAFETGLVAILWLLAMNCQNPAMRAKAIWLMKMWPRREGLSDGERMSSVVENVHDFAQSDPISTETPKLKLGSSAERAGEAKGDFYMHGFLKILSVLDGKRRMQSEGTESPEIILSGADYPV